MGRRVALPHSAHRTEMTEPTLNPGDQLGHYRLIEKIGGGGQGVVWRARDERFGRQVAIKVLPAKALEDSGARDRFRREAMAVGKLNHPNIATAHDFDTKPVDYLVTEYVSGSGLDRRLAGGALTEDTVITLGLQLAAGLEAAHKEGIIHRDLKPGNLRINQEGTLKILDFGLAEMFDPSKDVASLETITINMTLTGTLPYMAPEQFGGIADQRTDLWSAGAVLYEMATGKLPFLETQIQELREAIQHREPPRPREVNPKVSLGLEQVILRCLRKNPNQRYQSATELGEDLERLAAGRKTKEDEKRRARGFGIAALAAVLAISALVVAYYWPDIRRKLWPTAEESANQFRLMAILPLESGSQNPSDDALVRGVAETVSARIAQETNGQKLQLIPPSELIARAAKTTDAARKEFGVERVLEVAVQRAGNQVRVTCSLIDSKTHRVINACTVTGNGDNWFDLQDRLVGDVIAMLPPAFRNEQAAPTSVLAAAPAGYESYLKGKGYLLDYQKPENLDAAIKEFEQALKVNPNYAPALAGLGQAYWIGYQRQHKPKDWLDKALDRCQAALKVNPQLPEGHACLGDIYNSTGQYQQAVKSLESAARLKPDDVSILGDLGDAYDKNGNTKEAEATYQRLIRMRPDYWAVYNWLGVFYFAHGRYADAAEQFRKVTEISPDNARAYSNLGAMFLLLGKYPDSVAASRHSIELQPSKDAYENLGAAYFYLRQYSGSIDAFQSARKLDDRDSLAVGNLGDALYWSGGRKTEAADAYRTAVKLVRNELAVNPKDAVLTAYLAEYSSMLDERETALQSINNALQLEPKNPEVLFRSALVYNRFGDSAKTLEQLKKAVDAGFSSITIRDTPDFGPLAVKPEFRALTEHR
jgi:serine/threonine-protein kinase